MFVGMNRSSPAADAATPTPCRGGPRRAAGLLLAACGSLAAGCGGGDELLLGEYLSELQIDAPLESAVYVSLGVFDVPATMRVTPDGVPRTMWIRLSFELFAEAAPQYESAVTTAVEQHRGALNDALLTIIRTSSTDELTDPRLSALKLRMTEAARPMLGENKVRQLVLKDIMTDLL